MLKIIAMQELFSGVAASNCAGSLIFFFLFFPSLRSSLHTFSFYSGETREEKKSTLQHDDYRHVYEASVATRYQTKENETTFSGDDLYDDYELSTLCF